MNIFKRSLLILLCAMSLSVADKAFAATIYTGDSCSLLEAIMSAETNLPVNGCVSGSGSSDTIVLTQDENISSSYLDTNNAFPVITTNIFIKGNSFTINSNQTGNTNPFRLFEVLGGNFAIEDISASQLGASQNGNIDNGSFVKITNGKLRLINVEASFFSSTDKGGVVYALNTPVLVNGGSFEENGANEGGFLFMSVTNGEHNLYINNSEIKQNNAELYGGAIRLEGEISTFIDSSFFKNNTSSQEAGAILTGSLSHGKSLSISNSRFEGNMSAFGGAVVWGGWEGEVNIDSSTFFNNRSYERGGAFLNNDGAGTINIINSTFSGNESFNTGSAIFNAGEEVDFNVAFSTFISNASNTDTGAFSSMSPLAWNNANIENNIFYQNFGGDCNFETEVGLTKLNNFSDDGTCGDMLLSEIDSNLANNGGPTMTHKLLPGSNAIDGAVIGTIPCPRTDQRGYARMIDGNGDGVANCDVGSYEFSRRGRLTPGTSSASAYVINPNIIVDTSVRNSRYIEKEKPSLNTSVSMRETTSAKR